MKQGEKSPILLGGVAILLISFLFSALAIAKSRERLYDLWLLTAPLPEARVWPRAAQSNNRLYVIGGEPSLTYGRLILSTDLSSQPPTLASWDLEPWTSILPVSLSLHAVAQTDDYFYIIGGWDKNLRYSTVWKCEFGNLPCTNANQDFPLKIVLHDALMLKDSRNENYLYVFGGVNENNDPQDRIYKSKIEANGGLGLWEESISLPFPLFRMSAIAHKHNNGNNNFVYILGGYDGENIRPEIHRAEVNGNGTLVEWAKEKNSHMPKPVYYHDTAISGDRLYVFGGMDEEKAYRKVYSAKIDETDGSLGEWEGEKEIPNSLAKHAVVQHNGHFYIIGGEHSENPQSQLYVSVEATNTPTPDRSNDEDDDDEDERGIVSTLVPIPVERNIDVTPVPATATPTPFPGLAQIRLHASYDHIIEAGGELEYSIQLVNGPYPLSNLRITSPVPDGLLLLPAHFQLDAGFDLNFTGVESGSTITWISTNDFAPYQEANVSFRVLRPIQLPASSEEPVINHSGVQSTWSYLGQDGARQSNPAFNPATKVYLPVGVK